MDNIEITLKKLGDLQQFYWWVEVFIEVVMCPFKWKWVEFDTI